MMSTLVAGKDQQQWRNKSRRRVIFKWINWERQHNSKTWDSWAVLVVQCGDTEFPTH